MTSAGNSLLGSQHLITKVYFPRVISRSSSVVTALLDFAVAFVVLLAMMLVYGVAPAPQIVAVAGVRRAGVRWRRSAFGLWLSALSTQFRDVRHMAPFVIQLWLFCTPVLYPSSAVGGALEKRAPAISTRCPAVVDGFRWCVLGRRRPRASALVWRRRRSSSCSGRRSITSSASSGRSPIASEHERRTDHSVRDRASGTGSAPTGTAPSSSNARASG